LHISERKFILHFLLLLNQIALVEHLNIQNQK